MNQVNEVEYFSCVSNDIVNEFKFTEDFFEYEENAQSIEIKVAGRLKNHAKFWMDIQANSFVRDIIENGYVIPFYNTPPRTPPVNNVAFINNNSALSHSEFVSQAIDDLLKAGCIELCSEQPYIVNPLSVSVQRSGKRRLILDLSYVNKFVWKQSVKYEDLRTALTFLKKGGFMFQFDLKSGYHHIPISPLHHKFLGFAWVFKGSLSFFKFTVLPFGLTSAPYVFTKVVRPLVKKWRSEGKNMVVFLDDGLGFANNLDLAKQHSAEVKDDLIKAGFVPNVQKSIWNPVTGSEWLGFYIDLAEGELFLPARRIDSIKKDIRDILHGCFGSKVHVTKVHVKKLASVTGKIISAYLVLGSMSRLMTKAIHCVIETRLSWNSTVELSAQAHQELQFWLQNIDQLSSCPINFSPSCSKIVYSDASSTGFGAYVVDSNYGIMHGQWSESEKNKSSTWRELKAIELAIESQIVNMKNNRIKWFSDNQAVVKIISNGSMKPSLQTIALSIYRLCVQHNIFLEMDWIPRTKNEKADFISKIVDPDDWKVSFQIFEILERKWGPHTIDRFASYYNKKTVRFNSRFWNPGSEAIDAFTQNWKGENNWLAPPIHLISRVILQIVHCQAQATLICPEWKSAPFWPLLFPDGTNYRNEIQEIVEFSYPYPLLIQGRGPNTNLVRNMEYSKLLAIRFTDL